MAEASASPDWHPSKLSVIGEDTDHQLLFCKSTSGADYVVKYTYDENELRICEEYHSRSLQSPFLVQCPGKFRSHGIHGLVFDSSQNRNLGYMLRSRKNSSVSWSFRLRLARDICKKFIFLESQQIKSKIGRSNVFFTDDFCVQFLLSEFDDIVPNYVQAFSSLLEKILSGWQSVEGGGYANVAVREESRMPRERDLSVDDKDILEVLKRVRQICLRDGKTLKDVKKMLDPAWNDERKDNAWQDVLRLKLESGPSDTGTPLIEYELTKIKDERNYESRTDVKSIIRSHSESDQKALLAMPVSRNIIISKEFEFSNEYRSRLQDEGRNMLQDVGQNVLQDEDPDSLQDERTNRLQDVGQNVLQDEDPDRLQDERTNRLQDVGQNVLQDEDPDRLQDERTDRLQDEDPGRFQDVGPGRLQDVDPNRLQDVDPNRLQDEDPNRLQDVDPNRLQDEDSNRLQDVDPNRLQDEDPNRLQDEAPNRLQDEDPNSFQDEDPDRESQCERILSTVVIFIGAVLGALIGAVIGALIGDMFEALMKMACPYVGGFIGASVGVKAGAREGSAIVKSLLQSFRPKQLLGIILVVIIAFNRWPSKDIVDKLRGETESKLANVISTGMNNGLPDILPTLREVPIYDSHSVGFDVTLPHIFTVKGKKIRHVMVVGAAGSGKTTLLAKFAKLSLEGKIDLMAQIQSVVYIPFMDFNSKEHFTFEQLLAEMYYPNHHKKKDEIFEHLNDNQEKVLFVFDGYDQSGLSIIETTCQSISVTTKASLSTVFCNLFKGHLFPKSYLLTSSREYAVLELPMVARPSKTILLNGFSYPHLDVMMNLTNVGKKTMLQHVKNHPSDLRELCRSPMFFHFVRYMLESDPKSEMVYSFTGVIKHTFTRFVRSEHIRNGREVDSVLQKLEKLAYIGSMENRVKFNDKDLAACGLNNNRLIFDLQIRIKNGPYYHLFNGTTDYLFIHQTIQEYLSALHIVRSVPIYQFNSTVTMQLMKNGNWAVLRKFVTGILMNEKVSSDIGDLSEKRDFLLHQLALEFKGLNQTKVDTAVGLHHLTTLLSLVCEMDGSHAAKLTKYITRIEVLGVALSYEAAHTISCVSRMGKGLEALVLRVADVRPAIIPSLLNKKNQIETINLSDNTQLALGGDCSITEVLRVQKLKKLILRASHVEAGTVKCIAEALIKRKTEIELLDLRQNNISNDGVLPLLDTLVHITGELHLEETNLDPLGARCELHLDANHLQAKLDELCDTNASKLKIYIRSDEVYSPECIDDD